MAITTFKADVHHVAGLNVTATSTHHTITVDEPESLGGTDKGPNPVELLLDALGSCQAIAINAFAPKFKVKIKKLDIHVEGDIDLGGFLGTNSARRIPAAPLNNRLGRGWRSGRRKSSD